MAPFTPRSPNRFCDVGRVTPISFASCLALLEIPQCWQTTITVNWLQPAWLKQAWEIAGTCWQPTLPAALRLVRHELTSTKAFRVQQQRLRSKRLYKISPCVVEVASRPAPRDPAGLSQETEQQKSACRQPGRPSGMFPEGSVQPLAWPCP